MYVYVQSEYNVFTVGFYTAGEFAPVFNPESDHSTRDAAARRVNYLNGGNGFPFELKPPPPKPPGGFYVDSPDTGV
jgi:hypothetical protein